MGFYCSKCKKAEQKAVRVAHPNVMKDRDLKKSFGISFEEYQKMWENQNGLCAICGKPESHIRLGKLTMLRVDHNHKTGEIRALLCNSCNAGLGFFQDSSELLDVASEYLSSFRK